jgi:transcriptional regulator with XRE-family HTH domain
MKTELFGERLKQLRTERGLTERELAKAAQVYQSLISGLENEKRIIAERSARKIGLALGLADAALEDFIYLAINNSTQRVLANSKLYPAEVLNLGATLLALSGISPESIARCVRKSDPADANVMLVLNDGKAAVIKMEVAYE